ncbi:MAG: hypothetical protein DRI33_04465, partial [Caldiserica bacterium]
MNDFELTPEQIASSSLLSYVGLHYPKYLAEPMHELIATALEDVEAGKIRRLVISTPPQHGKCCDVDTNILLADGTIQKAGDIKIGSALMSCKGLKIVPTTLVAKEYTEKDSLKITTKTGREIIISKDHRMRIPDGYKKAKDLTFSDFLLTVNSEIEYTNKINENELHLITYMIFGNTSNIERRLPQQFFSMPLQQRWLFIDLMLQINGYFAQRTKSGWFISANKKLIYDIQTLLSSCKIISSVYRKSDYTNDLWTLVIEKSQLKKIYEKCNLGAKRQYCKEIIGKEDDYKPEQHFKQAQNTDFIFDQVDKIEAVGKRKLVHLQTTGTHTFIANGLVSHNTFLASEFFPAWVLGRNPDWKIIA